MELLNKKLDMPKLIVALILVLGLCSGCSILWPNNKKTMVKFSDIQITGKDTGLSHILNIDGYYEGIGKCNDVVLFYPDGFLDFNSQQGVYRIEGDSVIAVNLYTIGEAPDNSLTSAKMRIIDRDHIELIWMVDREKDFDAMHSTYGRKMSFVKLDAMPPFNGGKLVKQKFIWRSENDMKEWLKR